MKTFFSIFMMMAMLLAVRPAAAVNDNPPPMQQGPKMSQEDIARVERLNAQLKNLDDVKSEIQAEIDQIEKQIHFVARIAAKDKIQITVKPSLKSTYLYITNRQEYAMAKHDLDLMSPEQIQSVVNVLLEKRTALDDEMGSSAQEASRLRHEIQSVYNKYMSQIDFNSL